MSFVIARGTDQPTFEEWAKDFGYNGADQDMKSNYEDNVKLIDELNAADNGAEFRVNQFAGMTSDEFRQTYLTRNADKADNSSVSVTPIILDSSLTVTAGKMWSATPVRDQGSCGSCWAFAAVAAIEGSAIAQLGVNKDLSEQYVLDCSGAGNCGGGNEVQALGALKGYAIATESSYPYRGSQTQCSGGTACGFGISDVMVGSPSSDSTLASMLNSAALTAGVDGELWTYYNGGVVTGPDSCSVNHAVYIVGYTSDYYKIKNSWGTGWGEGGYIRLARSLISGCGMGILTDQVSYPVLSSGFAVSV